MRQSIYLFCLSLSIIIIFTNCDPANMASNKDTTTSIENTSTDWVEVLQNATNFKEETTLLSRLIQIDSTNTYQQLISNRLQTFDLRHLKEKEKLIILALYESSLLPTKQPASNTLQIAYAKLKNVHPTTSRLANEKIVQLLALIEKQAGDSLE